MSFKFMSNSTALRSESAKVFILFIVTFVSIGLSAKQQENFKKFAEHAETSAHVMDFSIVDQMLHAGVIDMGPSTRAYAKRSEPSLGTRLRQQVDRATENEANRFFYERLSTKQSEILKLLHELENIPNITPLNQFSKEALLAYWLNLHNVALIYEIASVYPLNNLRPMMEGANSILDKKTMVVDNTPVSLNDIRLRIVPQLYPDDLVYLYGFHKGIKGSPNIRRKAFTEENVISSLKDNAREFVNSNRGTQFNGGDDVVRISSFYERNAELFNDFDRDIKPHLLQFADKSTAPLIENAKVFRADIDNWRVTDLYGSIRKRDDGVYVNERLSRMNKLSQEQRLQLARLFTIRSINFGGGSVTVTDLPSVEETTEDENEEKDTK